MDQNIEKELSGDSPSAEMMIALMSNSSIGVALLDRDLRYISINEVLASMHGLSIQDHLGKSIHTVIPEAAKQLAPIFRGILASGQPVVNRELEVVFPADEHPHQVLTNYYPIKNDDAVVIGIGAAVIDITDRKAMETALKESEEQFRNLANSIPQLVWIADETGAIDWYNERWYEFSGRTPDETKGWGWAQLVHPDETERVVGDYRRAFERGQACEDTFRMKNKEGQWRWFLSRSVPIKDKQGRIVRWFGTETDITQQLNTEAALRESEEWFKLAVNVHQLGIWDLDIETGRIHWSREEAEILGYAVDRVSGRLEDVIAPTHPDDAQRVASSVESAIQGKGEYRLQFRILKPDGSIRWIRGTGRTLRDEVGNPVRFLATHVDITAAKEVEIQLLEAQELRDRFTSALSHDLRNPLSTARLALSLALQFRDAAQTEHREQFIHKAIDALDRANRMISDLLDANRIKAGQNIPIEIGRCDLSTVLEKTVDELMLSYGMRFLLQTPSSVEGYWNCDQMRRVIDNLVTNAVKYGSKETPITITLTEQGVWVDLRVHNFGGELSPKEQKHLFDLFQRTNKARSSGQQGWGIGLTLVKGIVEGHGGRIWVESDVGTGTTFIVEIPRDARPFQARHEKEA